MCDRWSWYEQERKKEKAELTMVECKSLIDDLFCSGIKRITFTGGEPTLRSDLPELVAYTIKKDMAVSIVSNGCVYLCQRYANRL